MKKTSVLIIVLILLAFSLSAASNKIGAQIFTWASNQAITTGGSSFDNEETGIGIIVAGSYYPSEQSSFGLGYQIGATTVHDTYIDGTHVPSSSNDPTTWRGGLAAQYSADLSAVLTLELGAGLLYEFVTDSSTSGGIETRITLTTLSLLSSANLLINLTDTFALVGGIGVSFPLTTNLKGSSGGITVEPDFDVSGYTFQAQIGVAFSI